MKTITNKVKLIFSILGLILILPMEVNSQCAYVSSNLGCSVDYSIDIYDYVLPPSGPCNGAVCVNYPTNNVGANSVTPINCGACAPPCNIVITITAINGTAFGPVSYDFSNTATTPVTAWGSPCTGPSGTIYIEYDPSTNSFKIHD